MKIYKTKDMITPTDGIAVRFNQADRSHPSHIHDFLEIVYITSGQGTHIINGFEYGVLEGDLLMISPGDTHSHTTSLGMAMITCMVRREYLSERLLNHYTATDLFSFLGYHDLKGEFARRASLVRISDLTDKKNIRRLFSILQQEALGKKQGSASVLQGTFLAVIALVLRNCGIFDEDMSPADRTVWSVIRHVEDHLSESISLREIAEKCCYNPNYLSTLFREKTGSTISRFIRKQRLEAAARLLACSDFSVEMIMEKTGFRDKKNFYRYFKAAYGVTPRKYADSDGCTACPKNRRVFRYNPL